MIHVCGPTLIFFYLVCQSVSHLIGTHMFEYFARPHVCLSVSPCKHQKNITCILFQVGFLGGRDMGLSLDLSFGGWGKCIFKIEFFGGGLLFYFEF